MNEEKIQTDSLSLKQTSAESRPADQLIEAISPLIEPLGYDVVYLEVLTQRNKTLRLYIDRLKDDGQGIGVEDCVRVTKALDEPLDQLDIVERIFKGSYELEVSSPGVDRPLRQAKDYDRFAGQEARIHVFRPLTSEEIENDEHLKKNPKQKNFLGVLQGVRSNKVLLSLSADPAAKASKKRKNKQANSEQSGESQVLIPLSLISKANLEPKFEFEEKENEI